MVDPATALLTAAASLALLALLLWPDRGLLARWQSFRQASHRVAVEDALKHLYDFEYRGLGTSLQSLAGALTLPGERAAQLIARLERLELLRVGEGALQLTTAGRREALRVIRIHRLWERYLSDQTGLDARRWHAEAERREHRTSIDEAEALSAQMGHPRFDPHGDPIPTAAGDIAPPRGIPLTDLETGRRAEVAHVEDEPEAIYAQLVAAGLHPGVRVRVLERTARRLRLEVDAEEQVLAPSFAANLSVVPLAVADQPPADYESLSRLELGERARVVGISAACRGAERRRILDLGLVPGTEVVAELRSPSGDPTAYRIRGAAIALRREQSDWIHVRREPLPQGA